MEIISVTPTEAEALAHENESLVRLITEDYPYSFYMRYFLKTGEIQPMELVKHEYEKSDTTSKVILAKEKGGFVGSLAVTSWDYNSNIPDEWPFWTNLRQSDNKLADRAAEVNPRAMHIDGFVSALSHRGEGVGVRLLEHAVYEMNPTIIVSQTKSVAAVMTRRNLKGFRTFFAGAEVSQHHEQVQTEDHIPLVHALLHTHRLGPLNLESEGVVFLGNPDITSSIPKVVTAPSVVYEAFKPIVLAQRRVGISSTVMAPLLSVRDSVMPIAL